MSKQKPNPDQKSDGDNTTLPKPRKKLWLGIAGLASLCALAGGYILYSTFFSHKPAVSLNAKSNKKKVQTAAHGDSSKETEASEEKPKDEHSGDKKEEHKSDTASEHSGDKKDDSKTDDSSEQKETKKESKFGETLDITKLEMNIGSPAENRFLRVALTLEFKGGTSQKEDLQKRNAQLRDLIMTIIGKRTYPELLSERGKEKLRSEITRSINDVSDKPINNVFFTEYLVE